MRPAVMSCVSVALVVAASMPAAATPRLWSARDAGQIVAVADSNWTSNKDEYLRQTQQEMREWRAKLEEFGQAAQTEAERGIDEAWAKTKLASNELRVAGAEQWDRAKLAFESAMQDLRERWRRLHPDDQSR